jgi:4'-phosphopantetheinyl transferase
MSRVLSAVDPALFCAPMGALRIQPNIVHVWSFFLATSAACHELCADVLSRAERVRANRFVDVRCRHDFIIAHGVLRMLLARYTQLPAATLVLSSGAFGKPALATGSGSDSAISFNMSHSHGRALIAVSDGRELGIDLEQVNPDVNALAIARRYFCDAERIAIESAAPSVQALSFFRYWVAKEAVLKGQGIGLRFPIDKFEIQFDARCRYAQVRAREDSRLADDWRIRMLNVQEDWIGAVAARGDKWSLLFQKLSAPRERVKQP